MVDGLVTPRCACNFCELMGRKKACDVSDGTWLLPVELVGLPATDPEAVDAILPLFPEGRLRNGCGCALEDTPVRAVPGRDSEARRLLLFGFAAVCLASRPVLSSGAYSEAMSVIRDDIILGGPATSCLGYCGKLPSLSVGEGVDLAALSPAVAISECRIYEAKCNRQSHPRL